jgi:hypothetical protein
MENADYDHVRRPTLAYEEEITICVSLSLKTYLAPSLPVAVPWRFTAKLLFPPGKLRVTRVPCPVMLTLPPGCGQSEAVTFTGNLVTV